MGINEEVIRSTVIGVLTGLLEKAGELHGFGEYGRGWNDGTTSFKMLMKGEIKKWQEKEEIEEK